MSAFAHGASCEDWESKLQSEIREVNQCEPKQQACLAKEFGNPMRELDYCKKVFKRCESLEADVLGLLLCNRGFEIHRAVIGRVVVAQK